MFRNGSKIIIEDAGSPSASYAATVRMEDLLEKLKILNYDIEFVKNMKMKTINR